MSTMGLLWPGPTQWPMAWPAFDFGSRGGGYLETQLDILHQKLFLAPLGIYIFSAEPTVF